MLENENLRAALASLSEDKILYHLAGIEGRYDWLTRELPRVSVRFALKSGPADRVSAVGVATPRCWSPSGRGHVACSRPVSGSAWARSGCRRTPRRGLSEAVRT